MIKKGKTPRIYTRIECEDEGFTGATISKIFTRLRMPFTSIAKHKGYIYVAEYYLPLLLLRLPHILKELGNYEIFLSEQIPRISLILQFLTLHKSNVSNLLKQELEKPIVHALLSSKTKEEALMITRKIRQEIERKHIIDALWERIWQTELTPEEYAALLARRLEFIGLDTEDAVRDYFREARRGKPAKRAPSALSEKAQELNNLHIERASESVVITDSFAGDSKYAGWTMYKNGSWFQLISTDGRDTEELITPSHTDFGAFKREWEKGA